MKRFAILHRITRLVVSATFAFPLVVFAQVYPVKPIQRLAGIDWVHASFQGFGPMIAAITGGQVPVGFITYAVAKGFLSTGKWKVIAVTKSDATGKAMAPPDAQIIADVVPGFEAMPVWMAIGGPANLPRPIVMRLNEAIAKAQREPNVVERYAEDKQVDIGTTPEVFERRRERSRGRADEHHPANGPW